MRVITQTFFTIQNKQLQPRRRELHPHRHQCTPWTKSSIQYITLPIVVDPILHIILSFVVVVVDITTTDCVWSLYIISTQHCILIHYHHTHCIRPIPVAIDIALLILIHLYTRHYRRWQQPHIVTTSHTHSIIILLLHPQMRPHNQRHSQQITTTTWLREHYLIRIVVTLYTKRLIIL